MHPKFLISSITILFSYNIQPFNPNQGQQTHPTIMDKILDGKSPEEEAERLQGEIELVRKENDALKKQLLEQQRRAHEQIEKIIRRQNRESIKREKDEAVKIARILREMQRLRDIEREVEQLRRMNSLLKASLDHAKDRTFASRQQENT